MWNSLPARSVELDSPAAFKADIERYFYAPTPTAPQYCAHTFHMILHEEDCGYTLRQDKLW